MVSEEHQVILVNDSSLGLNLTIQAFTNELILAECFLLCSYQL